jgi:hypothetical protein
MDLLFRSTCPGTLYRSVVSLAVTITNVWETPNTEELFFVIKSLKCKRPLSQPLRGKASKIGTHSLLRRGRTRHQPADIAAPRAKLETAMQVHSISVRPRLPQQHAALALQKLSKPVSKGQAISSSDPSTLARATETSLRFSRFQARGASSKSRSRCGCHKAVECSGFVNICGFDYCMMDTTREAQRLRRKKQSQFDGMPNTMSLGASNGTRLRLESFRNVFDPINVRKVFNNVNQKKRKHRQVLHQSGPRVLTKSFVDGCLGTADRH